jgi:hypothetical protein
MVECLHLVKCLLAKNKKCYLVIGSDVVDAVDIRCDKFEDEHDIVTLV